MVTKIIEDEKSLIASGNASTLLSFKALANHQHQYQQQQQQQQQQSFQFQQQGATNIPFYRQESSKSRLDILL